MAGREVCLKRLVNLNVALFASLILSLPSGDPTTLTESTARRHDSENLPGRTASADYESTRERIDCSYDLLPLSFELNRGQAAGHIVFLSRGSGYSLGLTPTEAVLGLRNPRDAKANDKDAPLAVDVLKIKLVGANRKARLVGLSEQKTVSNYFLGRDAKSWHANLPVFSSVRCENVYPGVSLVYYGNQRELEYDFTLAAGVDQIGRAHV